MKSYIWLVALWLCYMELSTSYMCFKDDSWILLVLFISSMMLHASYALGCKFVCWCPRRCWMNWLCFARCACTCPSKVAGTQSIDSIWSTFKNFIPAKIHNKVDHDVNPQLMHYAMSWVYRSSKKNQDGMSILGKCFAWGLHGHSFVQSVARILSEDDKPPQGHTSGRMRPQAAWSRRTLSESRTGRLELVWWPQIVEGGQERSLADWD